MMKRTLVKASPTMKSVIANIALPSTKRVATTTIGKALTYAALTPLYLGVLLPSTIASQYFVQSKNTKLPPVADVDVTKDLPFAIEGGAIKPFADRKYDIVLLGATGFTGSLCAEYLASGVATKKPRIAIAGRNEAKLRAVINEKMASIKDEVDIIICDTGDEATLHALVKDAKVVATTAGPFAK
jgi:hypothetical protein